MPQADGMTRGGGRAAWQIALVAAVTLAVYWRARAAGFVGDDFMILHRLRGLEDAADALRFFRGEFFEYYRPLGFVSHALDWAAAGADPRRFHTTNVLLHAVNAVLVWLIARALAPRSLAAPAAALLFAVHPSNHEAVVWISARFDLLATGFALAATWWTVTGAAGARWGAPALFFAALLSKESSVALPLMAAAWAVFGLRASTRQTLAALVPWLAVLACYALLREIGGGVPGTGGAARAPKLIAFAASLALVVSGADGRWERLRDRLLSRQRLVGALLAAAVVFAATVPVLLASRGGALAREKLSVAGFALFYLATPATEVSAGSGPLQPVERAYTTAAIVGLPAAALVLWLGWRRIAGDYRGWFLAVLLWATLLPVSALTEGRRYLYLPSAVVSIALGIGLSRLRGGWRAAGGTAAVVLIVYSAWATHRKVQDWIWAGGMTADAARLADAALAPACNTGHVVFLTSPVGVRSVYTHIYYETFTLPRGCMPETFQVVARLLRVDAHVDARWAGPDRIEIRVPDYRGNLLLSEDLRHFNRPLPAGGEVTLTTPLGRLESRAEDGAQRLVLTLRPEAAREAVFMFYSDGRLERLERTP
jgi:hypothetical protein